VIPASRSSSYRFPRARSVTSIPALCSAAAQTEPFTPAPIASTLALSTIYLDGRMKRFSTGTVVPVK